MRAADSATVSMPPHGGDLSLRRLRYFLTVAEELNYARAARRLGIAGPSLSQQIKTLERELKTQLFERDTRSVALTAAGASLLPHARALVAHSTELFVRAHEATNEPRRLVRLGMTGRHPVGPAIRATSLGFVDLDTWVMPSHVQAKRVAAGQLDVAICHVQRADLQSTGLVAHLVHAERLDAVCAGANVSPVAAGDVAVLIDAEHIAWQSWNRFAEAFARDTGATRIQTMGDGVAGRAFFDRARSLGLPILQGPTERSESPKYGLIRRRVADPTPLWTWSVIHRQSDDTPEVRAVVEELTSGASPLDPRRDGTWLPPDDPHGPA